MLAPPAGSWRPHQGEILDPPLHWENLIMRRPLERPIWLIIMLKIIFSYIIILWNRYVELTSCQTFNNYQQESIPVGCAPPARPLHRSTSVATRCQHWHSEVKYIMGNVHMGPSPWTDRHTRLKTLPSQSTLLDLLCMKSENQRKSEIRYG